jgi:hypothetical protein
VRQQNFSDAEYTGKKRQTRRAVPWANLEELIAPRCPKAGNSRQPPPLSAMLRIHCPQQWYGLSAPAMEACPVSLTISPAGNSRPCPERSRWGQRTLPACGLEQAAATLSAASTNTHWH